MGEQPVALTDGVITLRAWEPDDAPAVEACQDPLISRFIGVLLPYTEEVARQFVVRRRTDWDGDDERSFAITDAATGEVFGSIARHGPWGHRAQFGYWLAPSAPGRGVATRALQLITDWTLETTDVIRLDLFTHPDNDTSGRVAEVSATSGRACDGPGTPTVRATPWTPSSTSSSAGIAGPRDNRGPSPGPRGG